MSSVLVHYCEQMDLLLAADASPYGVGRVLSHRMEATTHSLLSLLDVVGGMVTSPCLSTWSDMLLQTLSADKLSHASWYVSICAFTIVVLPVLLIWFLYLHLS